MSAAAGVHDVPEVKACLDTLNKAVRAGFDDSAMLRHDPRLKLRRERQDGEFERIVAAAVAASQAANSNILKN